VGQKDGQGRVLESNALFTFPDQSKKGPDASLPPAVLDKQAFVHGVGAVAGFTLVDD
jgi:hypothetical protein